MIRRPRRSLTASLVALVLLVAAVLVTWSCVQVLLGRTPIVPFGAIGAAGAAVTAQGVLAAAAVVAALGMVLLVVAILPGRPTVLPLANRGEVAPVAGATRRSLRHAVAASAGSVDGVDRASATISGRTVTATVHTPFRAGPELTEQVRTAVTARLHDIALARPLRVRVRTTAARNS